jgi:predicted nucleic acid-binding protein
MGRLIVDADVLIDTLRRYPDAARFIDDHHDQIALSVVTVAELYAGVKGKREERDLINLCGLFERVAVSEAIAIRAGWMRNQYGPSHHAGLADCIVAATAESLGARVVTLNAKHYPMLKGKVMVPYRK